MDLGVDTASRIFVTLVEHLQGKRILAHPWFLGLMLEDAYVEYLKILAKYAETSLTFTPYFESGYHHSPITRDDLELWCRTSLDNFDAILGLGGDFGHLTGDEELEKKMINTPAVEMITKNKFLQYELLKDIPGLGMPETVLVPVAFAEKHLRRGIEKYGKVVIKPIDESQGEGVMVIDAQELEEYKAFIYDCLEQLRADLQPQGYNGDWNSLTLQRFIGDHQHEQKIAALIHTLAAKDAILIQPFVSSKPVVKIDSGQEHYARARVLWFGEYQGGYWGLSEHPIAEGESPFNPIVNYCKAKKAQAFTPEENERFRHFAGELVPKVLAKASEFVGRTDQLTALLDQKYKNAVLGTTE